MEKRPDKQRWKTPSLILAGIFAGVGLAIGHHAFYNSLHGAEPSTEIYHLKGLNLSKQQANIAIGTAFAFLIRACLLLSLSTAYVQVFWKALTSSSANTTHQLGNLDTAFSALNSLLALVNFSAWRSYPLLLLLATTSWLIPLASIITPAALTIEIDQVKPSPTFFSHQIPTLNFTSLSFAAGLSPPAVFGSGTAVAQYSWNGPSSAVINVAQAVGAQGTVLPITPPALNSSWYLEFYGPSLACDYLPEGKIRQIEKNIASWLINGTDGDCHSPPAYLGWFGELPFVDAKNGSNLSTSLTTLTMSSSDLYATMTNKMRLAILPNIGDSVSMSSRTIRKACVNLGSNSVADFDTSPLGGLEKDATMLECRLSNSTYMVNFDFLNGEQTIGIKMRKNESTVPFNSTSYPYGPTLSGTETCGTLFNSEINYTNLLKNNYTCRFDESVMQSLAYQGVMEGFTNLLEGKLVAVHGEPIVGDSLITTTTLMNTKELSMLSNPSADSITSGSAALQDRLSHTDQAFSSGAIAAINATRPLLDTLEEMFQNYTVSLMSSPHLQTNASLYPDLRPIHYTSITYRNVYTYSAEKLWLAYGIAILFTLIAVIIGLYIIMSTGTSYSNTFSTIFRKARGAESDVVIHPGDHDGKYPLPEYLKKATIRFPAAGSEDPIPLDYMRQEKTGRVLDLEGIARERNEIDDIYHGRGHVVIPHSVLNR
ncbi:hypothetical protein E6O75_ATG07377 [Venturia nashicola]|uniref:Uncharacterized protein n=1 Tax=Venturia nashicola TaxID=86259 RepID=A0A4Z1NUV9_9PEZI|nr:hypothetical protein E6O75_ATG07377 [Venturia nashicola]